MKSGKQQPYKKRHKRKCVMDGVEFVAARPEARTCCNACRSALRRWVKVYGLPPLKPPGRKRMFPPYYVNQEQWKREYVDPYVKKLTKKKHR